MATTIQGDFLLGHSEKSDLLRNRMGVWNSQVASSSMEHTSSNYTNTLDHKSQDAWVCVHTYTHAQRKGGVSITKEHKIHFIKKSVYIMSESHQ